MVAADNDTVIGVSDVAGIKIGDTISPYDTINPTDFPTPISQWDKANYVIAIGATSLTLSEPMTAPNGFDLVAQRPSMTNKTNALMSNGIVTNVTVAAGPVYFVEVPATNFSPDIIITARSNSNWKQHTS